MLLQAIGGLVIAASVILHILCVLFEIWLINFRAWCTLRPVSSVSDAECIKVIPVKYAGATEIVPLLKAKTEDSSLAFDYRRQHFWYVQCLQTPPGSNNNVHTPLFSTFFLMG